MTLAGFRNSVVSSTTGLPVSGATVTVTIAGTSTPATIYQDKNAVTPLTLLLTDSDGFFEFYAAAGTYDVMVALGTNSVVWNDVAVGTMQATDFTRVWRIGSGEEEDLDAAISSVVALVQSATEWSADSTTVLGLGRIGFESDTGKFKFGNGADVWSALSYSLVGLAQSAFDLADGDATITPIHEASSAAITGTAADDVDYVIAPGWAVGQIIEIDYRGTAGEFAVAIKSGGTASTIVSPITATTRYVARWSGTDWAIVGTISLAGAGGGLAVLPEIGILLTEIEATTALTPSHADLVLHEGRYKRQWLVPLDTETPANNVALTISGDNVVPKLAFFVDVPPDPDEEHGARTVALAATTLSFAGDFTDSSAVIEVTDGEAALAVLEAGDTIALQGVADWSSTDYEIDSLDLEADPPTITIGAAMSYDGEVGGPEESGEGLTFSVSKVVGSINQGTAPLRLVPGARAVISITSNPLTGPVVAVDGGIVAPATVHGDIVGSAAFDANDTPPAIADMNVTLPTLALTTGAKTAIPAYAGKKLLADDAITIDAGVFPAGTVMALWHTAGDGQPSFVAGTNVVLALPTGKVAAPAAENTSITAHYATTSGSDEVWHIEGNLPDAP